MNLQINLILCVGEVSTCKKIMLNATKQKPSKMRSTIKVTTHTKWSPHTCYALHITIGFKMYRSANAHQCLLDLPSLGRMNRGHAIKVVFGVIVFSSFSCISYHRYGISLILMRDDRSPIDSLTQPTHLHQKIHSPLGIKQQQQQKHF